MSAQEPKPNAHRAPAYLYRTALENFPGFALFIVDPALRYLAAEGKALADAGLSSEHFVGRTLAEAHGSAEAKDYERHYRRALCGDSFAWEHALGSRTFLSHGQPLRDPQDRIFAALVGSIDITERRMEREARGEQRFHHLVDAEGAGALGLEEEERLLQFGQAASVVLWTRNAETLQFEYLNPAFENIYGHSVAQIEPGDNLRNWATLIHPDDRAQALACIERVRQGERVTFEYRVLRADGQVRWLRNIDFPIMDETGKVIKIGGIGEDITTLKLAEDSLRAADRHKDEFLATLGHELRNPLAPLRNGLSLMRQIQGTDHRLARVVDMMDRQLSHLVRLVDDLLDLGRINAGKIQLALAPVPLAQALFRSIESVQSLIEAKNHSLEVHEPPEPLLVEGDADRLTQIFANLLSNAAKYTERGGRITVTLSNEGETAVARVDDTGIGIPEADLPRVFDLFSQVRLHQTHAQGGLGIGLSLVQRLVAMHGGSITAQSAGPGLGSTFTVRLPRLA